MAAGCSLSNNRKCVNTKGIVLEEDGVLAEQNGIAGVDFTRKNIKIKRLYYPVTEVSTTCLV